MDIKSPAVGKVLRLSVASGAQVARGDEVDGDRVDEGRDPGQGAGERAPVEFRVKPGDQIQRNSVLAVIEA